MRTGLWSAVTAGIGSAVLALSAAPAYGSATSFTGVGGNNTSVTPGSANVALSAFEAGIGGANNGVAPPASSGFRAINWDGVPAASSDPNFLPGDFFNATSPRGMVLSTPGTGVEVSASSFADINASYAVLFPAFSPTKVFSPIGSNVTDVRFFVPGTSTPATVRGFGAIFRNVENANSSSIQYFDAGGHSLGTFFVPVGPQNNAEFLGEIFNPETVARAEITSGTTALGPNDSPPATNVAILDDFAYAEPQAIPPPSLVVVLPHDGDTVNAPQVTVAGTATDASGVPSLTVNGSAVSVAADGSWSTEVPLSLGANAIKVVATNFSGVTTEVDRSVTYTDATPPAVMLTGKGKQDVDKLSLTAGSNEAASLSGQAAVNVPGKAKRIVRSKPASGQVAAGGTLTLHFKFAKRTLHAIKSAIAHGKHPKATITVTATDASGNQSTSTRTVSLRN